MHTITKNNDHNNRLNIILTCINNELKHSLINSVSMCAKWNTCKLDSAAGWTACDINTQFCSRYTRQQEDVMLWVSAITLSTNTQSYLQIFSIREETPQAWRRRRMSVWFRAASSGRAYSQAERMRREPYVHYRMLITGMNGEKWSVEPWLCPKP